VGHFCHFQKQQAKENTHPMGENSANLVTLLGTNSALLARPFFRKCFCVKYAKRNSVARRFWKQITTFVSTKVLKK
jgi:hypothetical protein